MSNECRICFEIDSVDNPLISPCLCSGTSKYVHVNCLKQWINTTDNIIAKKQCMECKSDYNITILNNHEYSNLLIYTSTSIKINYILFFFSMTPFTIFLIDDYITKINILIFNFISFNNNSNIKTIINYCSLHCYHVNLVFFVSIITLLNYTTFTGYFFYINNFLIKNKNDYNQMMKKTKKNITFIFLLYWIIYYLSLITNDYYLFYVYSILFIILEPYILYVISNKHNIVINIINNDNIDIVVNESSDESDLDDDNINLI